MDGTSQTSFIPKKPLAPTTPSGYERRSVGIIMLVSIIIFIGAIALTGGVLIYKRVLNSQIVGAKATLEHDRQVFEPATILELQRLDKRIETSKKLIKTHVATSLLFDILSRETLKTVRFTGLTITTSAESGKVALTLDGQAKSYASVALQSDAFSNSKDIREPVFTDLNLDQLGNIGFRVTAAVETADLLYEKLLPEAGSGGGTIQN